MVVQKGSSAVMPKTQTVSSAGNYEQISQEPLKHVVTFIEKKIRNLDKRKAKLDGYRKMVENGQTLDPDQKAAASKYDEVIGSLDFAKDLVKNFEMTITEVAKIQRKATRREQIAKEEEDNSRICFVMRAKRMMELLHDNEIIRNDFLNGTNRACAMLEQKNMGVTEIWEYWIHHVLSKLEMDQLVNFYERFIMDSYDAGTNIMKDANSSGNHLYELAEARSKDIVGTTYKELHAVIERLNNCDYFDDLPDTCETTDLPVQQEKAQVDSASSGASAEEDLPDDNALSPVASESLSSPTDFSVDMSNHLPLKTEEFVPSTQNEAYVDDLSETSWNQANVQTKPEAGDFIPQGMSFQFDGIGSNQLISQTYQQDQVQTIQDVLADVQGPCQFLQDSVIEAPNTGLSFMSMQPVITTMQPHQIPVVLTAPSHLRPRQLESGFTNASPVDNATIISSQVAANTQQQHMTTSNDSSSHMSQTVNHSETSNMKSVHDSLHMNSQQLINQTSSSLNMDTVNYHTNMNQANYVTSLPTTTGSSRNSPQEVDYMNHTNQPENLGLGQTTFGGQQQNVNSMPAASNHPTYVNTEGTPYDQDNLTNEQYKPNNNYGSTPQNNVYDSNSQSVAPNMIPHQLAPDPPTTHIPLPNEQQSGYRSYQATDNPQLDMSIKSKSDEINQEHQGVDVMSTGAMPNQPHSQTQYDGLAETRTNNDMQGEVPQVESGVLPGQKQLEDNHTHVDQMQGYRGARPQQGAAVRPPRGGYNSSAGYNRPMNPGGPGGYHQQRNSYRVNNRYTGSYDSMGRPSNFSGYQNSQSNYVYRSQQQENSYNYRRGAGGNMRGRGHPQRGNARGNYNRSRTFRPQHPTEQST